ncbi:MAG: hypothetical protein KJP07_07075 [Desulfatitalea sp.]|nr:hypothetical protein [Desulfatitalea sp.]
MEKKQEKWAIFWCDLLSPILYEEIEPAATNQFLKILADKPIPFPDGSVKKPSLSTLRGKLNRYKKGGFDALEHQKRADLGKPRNTGSEVIKKVQRKLNFCNVKTSLIPPTPCVSGRILLALC